MLWMAAPRGRKRGPCLAHLGGWSCSHSPPTPPHMALQLLRAPLPGFRNIPEGTNGSHSAFLGADSRLVGPVLVGPEIRTFGGRCTLRKGIQSYKYPRPSPVEVTGLASVSLPAVPCSAPGAVDIWHRLGTQMDRSRTASAFSFGGLRGPRRPPRPMPDVPWGHSSGLTLQGLQACARG